MPAQLQSDVEAWQEEYYESRYSEGAVSRGQNQRALYDECVQR